MVYHRNGYRNPIPTTDVIIQYSGGFVLIERRNAPHGLALPGGFAEHGIALRHNAMKEAKEETNLDLEGLALFGEYSDPSRDPRDHMISITYTALGSGFLAAGDDVVNAYVVGEEELQKLALGGTYRGMSLVFDHAKIISDYLRCREGGRIP
jgi:ADP-ribose pyrophosphatase YjhB (NUDIX family)